MTLQLHQPDGKGGLQPSTVQPEDWRTTLRSSRWRPARLANPEMNPTSRALAVLFWVGLAILTFAILVVGYGSGFWQVGS